MTMQISRFLLLQNCKIRLDKVTKTIHVRGKYIFRAFMWNDF
jgi:hypothetical protein